MQLIKRIFIKHYLFVNTAILKLYSAVFIYYWHFLAFRHTHWNNRTD